jgi:hypothetical protein
MGMEEQSGINAYASLELIERVTSFAKSALIVDGRPISGTARVGISSSRRLVFLEIRHDDQPTFQTVTRDRGAMQALERLRAWIAHSGSAVLLERGPSDEFVVRLVDTQSTAGLAELPAANHVSRQPGPHAVQQLRGAR